jgi:hypothetical protein
VFEKEFDQLLADSSNLLNKNHALTDFFNNSSMAKILDVFLDNPDLKITIEDVLDVTKLSRKSVWLNFPKLVNSTILLEEQHKHHKFYVLNGKNPQVKQISQFRDILIRNASTINTIIRKKTAATTVRRVNTKHEPKRRTGQSKKISGKV